MVDKQRVSSDLNIIKNMATIAKAYSEKLSFAELDMQSQEVKQRRQFRNTAMLHGSQLFSEYTVLNEGRRTNLLLNVDRSGKIVQKLTPLFDCTEGVATCIVQISYELELPYNNSVQAAKLFRGRAFLLKVDPNTHMPSTLHDITQNATNSITLIWQLTDHTEELEIGFNINAPDSSEFNCLPFHMTASVTSKEIHTDDKVNFFIHERFHLFIYNGQLTEECERFIARNITWDATEADRKKRFLL